MLRKKKGKEKKEGEGKGRKGTRGSGEGTPAQQTVEPQPSSSTSALDAPQAPYAGDPKTLPNDAAHAAHAALAAPTLAPPAAALQHQSLSSPPALQSQSIHPDHQNDDFV